MPQALNQGDINTPPFPEAPGVAENWLDVPRLSSQPMCSGEAIPSPFVLIKVFFKALQLVRRRC